MLRPRVIILAVLAISVALVFAYHSNRRNRAEIRTRYAELGAALSAADTNSVLALIAPGYRTGFNGADFMRLNDFAQQMAASSKVLIFGGDATVWPKPNWYLCGILPIGNTIEMTKVGDRWFFTGTVHLD